MRTWGFTKLRTPGTSALFNMPYRRGSPSTLFGMAYQHCMPPPQVVQNMSLAFLSRMALTLTLAGTLSDAGSFAW
jgi:hypothetical protein